MLPYDESCEILNSGFSGSRGDIWKRPASEMNQFRLGSGGPAFRDDHIIIRRARGSGGDLQEVFGCDRSRRHRRRENITIPLSSESGALEGYIGCVS